MVLTETIEGCFSSRLSANKVIVWGVDDVGFANTWAKEVWGLGRIHKFEGINNGIYKYPQENNGIYKYPQEIHNA